MNKLVSIFKDFSISAVIAVLTANLITLPNLVYQIVITILILALIFFILRSLDKLAKRLEILSVLYCENLVLPFLKAMHHQQPTSIDGKPIAKVKLYIILPNTREDIAIIENQIKQLERFTIATEASSRSWYLKGSILNQRLMLFDTPLPWALGIGHLIDSNKLKPKQIKQLLEKMSTDVKAYAQKNIPNEQKELIAFIDVKQFNLFFT